MITLEAGVLGGCSRNNSSGRIIQFSVIVPVQDPRVEQSVVSAAHLTSLLLISKWDQLFRSELIRPRIQKSEIRCVV